MNQKETRSQKSQPRFGASHVWKASALTLSFVATASQASTDWPGAAWVPSQCGSRTSGYGHRFMVVHDMEGYYTSGISWLTSCNSGAGVHYAVNGKKDNANDSVPGAITQMVRDVNWGIHARCWNYYSAGVEHEGFASNPAWYTEAMYQASGALFKSKTTKYGIAKDRNHVIAHGQKLVSGWVSWVQSAGYSYDFATCNTHTDPGPGWNWAHFMDIIKGGGAIPSAPSGLSAVTYSTSQIDLTWTDTSTIETGFKVERATSSAGPYTQIGTTVASDRTYSSTGLASGTTYWFRVRAYNAYGNSAYCAADSAVTKDTIPAAATSLTATAVSDTQINLTWAQAMANEDGFRIYRSTDNVTYTLVATVGINVVSYSNTGLTGNRLYYYKVYAYNTAGNSAASNVASDTTAPQPPSGLVVNAVAGTANWNKFDLAWTDNSSAEVGFKVERGTALAGPFTQIATTAAGVATYQDSGLAASTTYYYRVRSYNANGNSAYSAVVSRAVGNSPPILAAIGNKTVAGGTALTFTATASDPNAPAATTNTIQTFQSFPHNSPNETVLFNRPANSASTSGFLDATADSSIIFTNGPAIWGTGNKALRAYWGFKTGFTNLWLRLNTFNTPTNPNPTIALDQKLQFKFYGGHTYNVAIGVRETGTTAAYGANGGTTGSIKWVGINNVVGGVPMGGKTVPIATGTNLSFNIPFESQVPFTGSGEVDQSGAKGTLEHIVIQATSAGAAGVNSAWIDDLQVVTVNNLTYSLDAGAPTGATIGRRNGKFAWTPTTGQAGVYSITVRVTDNLGAQDFETIKVTVTGTGNAAPVLSTIGNKTVNEGSALSFTAVATDADVGQTKTFTLDAGNPSGSSITTGGAFSWTPTEAQGPGSYPITVRVTDNGSPASNDVETITVTVNEVNTAPVLATIANQSIDEGQTFTATASATDTDSPANTITYSIAGPVGMTIDPVTGAISYTPGEGDGGDVDQVTVTATDNGSPALKSSKTFTVTVNEVNSAPTIGVGTKSDYNMLAGFDELDDEGLDGHNTATGFRIPYFSATTSAFLGSTSYSYLTNDFPRDSVNKSYQALYVNMTFLTGTTNPWCRLTTYSSPSWSTLYAYPNPTIALDQHVRVKIWSSKSIKVALGVRETGTTVPYGFNGGITGTVEWVGATINGSAPNPNRTITASNWTQLDFNLPAEAIAAFTGNGVLASGKGVLEHLAIVPNGGMGNYQIYVDDLEMLTTTTNPTFTADTLDTVTFTATATDPDIPKQNFTYSLTSAPADATITPVGGVFSWKIPADAPATNVITVTVTDDGSPAMSSSTNITIYVHKVNTPPSMDSLPDQLLENGGGIVTFSAGASDDDVPGDTLTFSLTSGPAGATIDPTNGVFTWTAPPGVSTNTATIRVTDNGVPPLWSEQTVSIIVVPTNHPPVLGLGVARATESVITFETFTNNTPNEQVMFKKPLNSATTSAYINTAVTNYTTLVSNGPSAWNSGSGNRCLKAYWSFKTGTTNYWVRLNTGNTTLLPNPTINASARLTFDIYCDKAIKVGLGIRETGTTAENGANGGTTGAIEYVGCTSQIGTTPVPTRLIAALTPTTVEFDLPNEPCQTLTGDSVLAGGQQVLEHLIIKGEGGTGAYSLFLDNFKVVTTTTLPGTINMKANSALTFTATATDPDPGTGVTFGLDPDFVEAYPTALLNQTNGVFTWTPTVPGTVSFGVTAEDDPTNGGIFKTDTKSVSVVVVSDTLAAQSGDGFAFVAGGDSVTLTWDSIPGMVYLIQSVEKGGDWKTVGTVTATGNTSSTDVSNDGNDARFRVVSAQAINNE